ncbi:MAG: hypothetical protein ABSF53_02555 [Terracidiphilus sp.]
MTSWQDNPAVINVQRRLTRSIEGRLGKALDQCSATCRAPVGDGLWPQFRMAMAANAFHKEEIT